MIAQGKKGMILASSRDHRHADEVDRRPRIQNKRVYRDCQICFACNMVECCCSHKKERGIDENE